MSINLYCLARQKKEPRLIRMHVTSCYLNPRMCCKGCFFNNKSDYKAKVVIQQQGRPSNSSRKGKKVRI